MEIDKVRPILGSSESDISLWRGTEGKFKDKFSTKHTWNQIRRVQPRIEWYKGVWLSYSTPKYSFLVWLAMHNRLTTGDRMSMWNAKINVLWYYGGIMRPFIFRMLLLISDLGKYYKRYPPRLVYNILQWYSL